MSMVSRLENYLKEHKVEYHLKVHPEAYTAQEVAAAAHVPGRELAKVVMLKKEAGVVMVVLPANCQLDFDKLGTALNEPNVKLAKEDEFEGLFPDCETGAMPPFGNLYNVPMCIDQHLASAERLVFNAGNHHETVDMLTKDLLDLTEASIVNICSN